MSKSLKIILATCVLAVLPYTVEAQTWGVQFYGTAAEGDLGHPTAGIGATLDQEMVEGRTVRLSLASHNLVGLERDYTGIAAMLMEKINLGSGWGFVGAGGPELANEGEKNLHVMLEVTHNTFGTDFVSWNVTLNWVARDDRDGPDLLGINVGLQLDVGKVKKK